MTDPRASGTRALPVEVSAGPRTAPDDRAPPAPPFLLDFYPLEEEKHTRLSRFFDALREGRFVTTRCPKDGSWHWPPRVACPTCHAEELVWTELPRSGTVYAFSALLAGAPMGMESDVPFVVGLVDLDGVPLRLFGRIAGTTWDRLRIGDRVDVEPFEVGGGRYFYRFRARPVPDPAPPGS